MKTLKFVLLAVFSLCLMSTVSAQNTSGNKAKTKHSATAYQCPMNCEEDKTYAKSGKCPVCKMTLTKATDSKLKKAEHENHNHN